MLALEGRRIAIMATYASFRAGPWDHSRGFSRAIDILLGVVIPRANPDYGYDRALERVHQWWFEIDGTGQVQREIGLDAAQEPLVIAPIGRNAGIFTDQSGAPAQLGPPVEAAAFEAAWQTVLQQLAVRP